MKRMKNGKVVDSNACGDMEISGRGGSGLSNQTV